MFYRLLDSEMMMHEQNRNNCDRSKSKCPEAACQWDDDQMVKKAPKKQLITHGECSTTGRFFLLVHRIPMENTTFVFIFFICLWSSQTEGPILAKRSECGLRSAWEWRHGTIKSSWEIWFPCSAESLSSALVPCLIAFWVWVRVNHALISIWRLPFHSLLQDLTGAHLPFLPSCGLKAEASWLFHFFPLLA